MPRIFLPSKKKVVRVTYVHLIHPHHVPSAALVERHAEFPLSVKISQYIPFEGTYCFGIVTAETIIKTPLNCNISKNYLWHAMGYIVIFNHLAGISNFALLVPPIVQSPY